MNNEFVNKIAIIPSSETPTIIAAPFSEFDILSSYIDIDPRCKGKDFKGNPAYEFKMQAIFREVSESIINKYKFNRPVVLLLFDDEDNFYQVGTELIPIFVGVNSQKLATEFNFIGRIPDSPF